MKLERITLREIRMPLLSPFETSFGATEERRILLVEVAGEGATGWGEVTATEGPFYNEEFTDSAWQLLKQFAIPKALASPLNSAAEASARWSNIRGHYMATGGLEAALWDWEAKLRERPLHALIGGVHREIPCGVSIGIKPSIEQLLETIAKEVAVGYQRIKIKIKPGWDIDAVAMIRERFGDIPLMVDANAAYHLADAAHLSRLDPFGLMMIEQPLDYDDIRDHAALQRQIRTPICLDESLHAVRAEAEAIEIGACRIINIKPGRVGGHGQSIRLHDLAAAHGIPVWHGGMLESGIGRAHNIHLSTLANFRLPGDVAASRRYYAPDLIDPEIDVRPDGTIAVPTGPGIGVTIDWNRVAAATEARLETRMNTDHGSTPTTDDHGSTRKAEPPKART